MSVLSFLGAVLTIIGPALTPLLLKWVERYQRGKEDDEIDAHIRQHFEGNKAGLIGLSAQLERLHREAQRKRANRSE